MKLSSNDVAVITGASTGMGRELALQLADRGVAIAICDVDMDQLERTRADAEARGAKSVTAHHCDVSDANAVKRFCDEVVQQHGEVSLLFNNAGIAGPGAMVHAADMPQEDLAHLERSWDKVFNVCFYGVLYCTRAFLPLLQQSASAGEAYLINTSSVFGLWGCPEASSYVAAKHAVKGLTESLLSECAMKYPTLHIACVHPGGVSTDIVKKGERPPKETPGEREEMANLFESSTDLTAAEAADWILRGVERNSTRMLIGYDAYLLDLATRLGPRWCYEIFLALGRCEWGGNESLVLKDRLPPSVTQILRTMFGGGWYMVLMLSPMTIIKARRHAPFKPTAAALVAAALYSLRWHRSKL